MLAPSIKGTNAGRALHVLYVPVASASKHQVGLLRFDCRNVTKRGMMYTQQKQKGTKGDVAATRSTQKHRQTQTDTDRHRQTQTNTDKHKRKRTQNGVSALRGSARHKGRTQKPCMQNVKHLRSGTIRGK